MYKYTNSNSSYNEKKERVQLNKTSAIFSSAFSSISSLHHSQLPSYQLSFAQIMWKSFKFTSISVMCKSNFPLNMCLFIMWLYFTLSAFVTRSFIGVSHLWVSVSVSMMWLLLSKHFIMVEDLLKRLHKIWLWAGYE